MVHSQVLKNRLCHKNWTYSTYRPKWSTIIDQKSNFGIPLDLHKRSSKIREDFASDPQLNDIIEYGVMMDLQKKSFIEPAESCPHLLKITLWKLGHLVQKYRIAI